jgi:DUF1680 family protein
LPCAKVRKTFFEVTLIDTFDKFEKDGTIQNFQDVVDGRKNTHRCCPWHDGLLNETIRGAADYLARGEKNDTLVERIDSYIDVMALAQDAIGDGYLHTLVQLEYPHRRFGENGGNILWQHDLYNHGCLFEASVHYYKATGKAKLLEVALKAANYLCDTIGEPPKKWIVPGHALPEYAIMELYELCVDEPGIAEKVSCPVRPEDYRALGKFWVYARGYHDMRTNHPQYMGEYSQDHAPIHQQYQAVGHAVRANLYYTAVTRQAMLDGDETLLNDSIRLWNNVVTRKLHINGGVGATHFEEKYGTDYDLINSAYLETCATVALIFWAESLSRATGDARYFHVIERGLYNLMLSSVSLSGDFYFYRNPLMSDGSDHRWAWHTCPCCPPMIHKTFGMFDKLIYAQNDESLFVNLHIGGEAALQFPWGTVRIKTAAELPWKGTYSLAVEEASQPFSLKIRVPEWARDLQFTVNGKPAAPAIEKGYAVFEVAKGDVVAFYDAMKPCRMEAHPYVGANRGRVALTRGPLVYCVEGVDNRGEVDFTIADDPQLVVKERKDLLGGIDIIRGKTIENEDFVAVPLYTWDNRMAGKMCVWLKQSGKVDSWHTVLWADKLYRPYSNNEP